MTALDGTTKQISFTIHGSNDGAVIGDPTVHDVTEDANAGNLTASGTLSISDADQNQASFQTGVTGAQGNLGSLTLQANGSYTYTVANSLVQYLGLNDTKIDTFTVTALDGTTKQISFTIHGTDDAPVLSNVAATASYTQNDPAVTLSPAAAVSDVDDQFLESATVSISSGLLAGDVLSANVAGTSITWSYNDQTGVLTLTGHDTLADYQQVLDSVAYSSTSGNPTNFGNNPSRTISWVVNDGSLDSATQITTLNITADVVTIPANTTISLNGGTLQASFIDVEGTLIGFGTITAAVITNNGTITAKSNHTLLIEISGSITGTGTLEITNNTTLTLDGPVGPGQTILFDIGGGPSPILVLQDPSHFQGQISSFQGSDQIQLPTITFDSGTTWAYEDNGVAGDNTGGTLRIFETVNSVTTTVASITFADGDYTTANFKLTDDGTGHILISDPPASTTTADASTATTDASTATTDPSTTTTDATVTPVAQTSTPTATETTSSRRKVTYVTDDDGIMVALSTAVAFAVSAAVSDADGSEMSGLTIDGNDTAVDLTGTGSDSFRVDSDGAPKFSPISHRTAETLAEDGTVEVIDGKLEIAHTASETGMLEIDAGATLQLEGSDAVDAPVIADGTNADAISLPGNSTIKTAWHFSDDGGGGKSVKDLSVSATGEDTSAQSTSADNAFTVSSPFAATLSGNGDYSALPFMTNWDHHASANPDINDIAKGLLQHPADTLLHVPAQLADNGPPTVTDGAHPAHPHFDGNQSVGFKFADDGSSHPGPVPHDPPALAANDLSGEHSAHPFKPNSDHHASAGPGINDIAKDHQHPADNLSHGPAQHDDNGSPTVTDGAHPAHPHSDGNQRGNPQFADDGSDHPGKVPHDPPTALSSDLSGDSAHPSKPNSDHQASADPEIKDIAKDHLPQHAADNLPHGPAQHADSGPPAVTDGAHPAHPHSDGNQPANPKFADDGSDHPGKVPHDPPTALSSDLSGDHPASPVKPNLDHSASADPETSDVAKNLLQHPNDNFKFADDDSAHPGKVPHDPPTALSSDLGEDHPVSPVKPNLDQSASADPGINDIAKDHQHPADNLPHGPAQLADNGSPTVTDGVHPAHPDFDNFKFADDDSAHLGKVPHDPPALATMPSDFSGEHGPAAPGLAKTFDVPDPGSDQFIFGKSHEPPADLKSDMTEIDPTTIAEIQQLLDIAHDSNAVGPLDPHHAMAPQDVIKAQLPQPPGEFHFA